MSYNIIVTSEFKKQTKSIAKKHRSLKDDLISLIETLSNQPFQGEALGKDCFKVRLAIASKGKGKSGGGRVITCVKVVDQNVYLLAIYDKSERESISDKEIDTLLELAGL